MKTKILSAVLISLVLINCGKDDSPSAPSPDSVVEPPVVELGTTTLTTTLGASGSFEAPNIDWNNEEGTIEISSLESDENETVNGITLNKTTGVVSWDENIPLGKTDIELTFTNSEGSATLALQLDNSLAGIFFAGNFNEPDISSPLYFEFLVSDKLIVHQGAPESLVAVMGTWVREGDSLVVNYLNSNHGDIVTELKIIKEGAETGPSLNGTWRLPDEDSNFGSVALSISEKPEVRAPSFSFDSMSFQATYYKGETIVLQSLAHWGWELGSISIADIDWSDPDEVQGVTIDSELGALTWDNTLPLGDIPVTISFENSARQTNRTFTIKNNLANTAFHGFQNQNPDSEELLDDASLTFKLGTVVLRLEQGDLETVGLWSIEHNMVSVVCNDYFGLGMVNYNLELINNGNDAPYLEGFWYQGETPEGEMIGRIRLEMFTD